MRQFLTLALVCAVGVVLAAAVQAWAAGATVRSGTIVRVSPAEKTLVVRLSGKGEEVTLRASSDTIFRLNGSSSQLESLEPGMAVSIEVAGESQLRRVLARKAKETSKTTASSTTPQPAKTPALSKSKGTSSKAASKSAGRKSERMTASASAKSGGLPPAKIGPVGNPPLPADAKAGNSTASASNWPCFLGPKRDNISAETGLLRDWPAGGPAPVWAAEGLGAGFSSVSIAGGAVYTMGTGGNQESVLAVDLASGKPLWSVSTGGDIFQESHGNGPRSTPTIDGDRLYALGATGQLVCVDLKSQKIVWQKNLIRDFGARSPVWGFTESVLIDGPQLICTPGGPKATMVALNKENGDLIWFAAAPSGPSAAYSSTIAVETAGGRQYVNLVSRGSIGVAAHDGRFLWASEAAANPTAICSAPLLVDGNVFVASGYGAGGALIEPNDGGQPNARVLFTTPQMKNHHGGMIAIDGHVYGCDEAILTCLSLDRRQPAWKNRSVGKGSLTCADGMLYLRSEEGPVALVEATPAGYREHGRFTPPRTGRAPAWPYPVVAAGKLFLRDQDTLVCYSLTADAKAPVDSAAAKPAKRPARSTKK